VADVLGLAVASLVTDPGNVSLPAELIAPAAVLNAAIAALLLYPTRVLAERYAPEERGAW
jgi:hypothetical protein